MVQIVLRLSPLPPGGGAPVEPGGAAPRAGAAAMTANGYHEGGAMPARPRTGPTTPLAGWSAPVATAHDACVLVDTAGRVVSISASGAAVLGCAAATVTGRPLLDVVTLVDFATGEAPADYAARIPPLSALKFATLVRGLLRVRAAGDRLVTVDAVAAPLHDGAGEVVGSITFLAPVAG